MRIISLSAALLVAPLLLRAQESRRSLDLGANGAGLSIGDSPRWKGIRLNAVDTRLERMDGINLTVWSPRKTSHGVVRGIALNAPLGGAKRFEGIAIGGGYGVEESMKGLSLSLVGGGAGSDVVGIHLAGVGFGSGGSLRGINIAGVGAGAGGRVEGITIGGVGVGTGGNGRGLLVGGVGAGVGGDFEGIAIGGVGTGVGGNFRGLSIAGVGTGSGGNFTGIALAGVGTGAGGTLHGLALSGVGVGATAIRGIAAAGLGVGGQRLTGVFAAAYTIRIADVDHRGDGELHGVGISAFNDIRGRQRGLTIGVVNYARSLHGAQVGVINIVRNNPKGRKVLPVVNWGR
ncbi:MAG: hypothetical protein K2R93_05525 [Gemmatimonadaceae bacterium]|nr:hypothetical protein [Gemmatimonadaceae bacterium]